MKPMISFGVAVAIAASAFAFTMISAPPVSVAGSISQIDTRALTLLADPAMGQDYDCN